MARVEVEGLGGEWWMRAEDAEALPDGDWRGRTALLSPFDNLLCDRARAEELFGFSHRLEIYTPKAKRVWGYFVLPILHHDRLIGRADLRDRPQGERLIAHAVHREPNAPRGAGIARRHPPRARAARELAGRDGARAARRAGRLGRALAATERRAVRASPA